MLQIRPPATDRPPPPPAPWAWSLPHQLVGSLVEALHVGGIDHIHLNRVKVACAPGGVAPVCGARQRGCGGPRLGGRLRTIASVLA